MLIMTSLRGTVIQSTACIRRIVDVKIRGCMRNEGAFGIRIRLQIQLTCNVTTHGAMSFGPCVA